MRRVGLPHSAERRAFRDDTNAVIAVETALVFSLFLVPLFLGGADVAMLMKTRVQLEGAVKSAVFFAYSSPGNATDVAGIESAAQAGYGASGPPLTVHTPAFAYYCIATTGTEASGTAVASPSASCPTGEFVATWMSVSVAANVALPVSIKPFQSSVSMSADATVRVE